jgi:hypothetical protein
MAIAKLTRINAEGIYQTNGIFDEVSRTTIGANTTAVFANEFDEMIISPTNNGLVKRETRDGTILVSGYFDEQTIIT